jgi:hypothetical protein
MTAVSITFDEWHSTLRGDLLARVHRLHGELQGEVHPAGAVTLHEMVQQAFEAADAGDTEAVERLSGRFHDKLRQEAEWYRESMGGCA